MADPAAEAQQILLLHLPQNAVAVRAGIRRGLALLPGLKALGVEFSGFCFIFQFLRHGCFALFRHRLTHEADQCRTDFGQRRDVVYSHALDSAARHGSKQSIFRVLHNG